MVIRQVLARDGASNRLLRLGLAAIAGLVSISAFVDILRGYPWGADLEIALRAAERWIDGGQPYVAAAFSQGPGYDLPFLYPPYALPLFAPLTAIPRPIVHAAWFVGLLVVAYLTCRRLRIPQRWIPALLVWPPFAEGLISGNIQILIFAAFVALLVPSADHGAGEPDPPRSPVTRGLLTAWTTFLKVGQPHVLVHLARWERRTAAVAVLAIAILALATLPFLGTAVWFDWVEQLRRAADPGWVLGGPSLANYLPAPLGLVVVAACLLAVLVVPRASAAAWVGVLLVIGATSIHTYYLLFLLPAMLRIRLEIALVAALLIATYTEPGWWIAIAMVTGALAAARSRPELLERAPMSPPRHGVGR